MEQYNYTDELNHHGVKGMKWGVRRTYARNIYRKGKKVHSKGDPADRGGLGVRTKVVLNKNGEKSQHEKQKTVKQKAIERVKKKVTKESAKKAAAKGAIVAGQVATQLATASLVDDIFYGGTGKKIAKETIKQTGRAVITAFTMARGGYNIRWYDN